MGEARQNRVGDCDEMNMLLSMRRRTFTYSMLRIFSLLAPPTSSFLLPYSSFPFTPREHNGRVHRSLETSGEAGVRRAVRRHPNVHGAWDTRPHLHAPHRLLTRLMHPSAGNISVPVLVHQPVGVSAERHIVRLGVQVHDTGQEGSFRSSEY